MKTKETEKLNKMFVKLTDEEVALVSGGQKHQAIFHNTNSGPVPVDSKHGPIHVTD